MSWPPEKTPDLPQPFTARAAGTPGEALSLGQRAYRHATRLAAEIGPRPAGSRAEARARDEIAETLSGWGYQLERIPVAFAPAPRFSPYYFLAGLVLVAGGFTLPRWPWSGLLLPALFFALPQVTRWAIPRRKRTGTSENLLARLPGRSEAQTTLVLCAHLDSARAGGIRSPFWRRLFVRSLDLAQRAAFGLAAVGLLGLLGLPIPRFLWAAAALAGLLAGGWLATAEVWNQLDAGEAFSPGANDNASGVGVLLALAEAWAGPAREPSQLALEFLFTTAEETGLHGAEAQAAIEQPGARGEKLVLSLDMVGAGNELRYADRDGTLVQRKPSGRLNELIRQADPAARPLWYIEKSGDYLPFLKRGLPATGIQITGSAAQELAYHSPFDRAELLEPAALERTARTVWEVIRLLQVTG